MDLYQKSPLVIALIAAEFGRQDGDSLEGEAKILQNKQKFHKMISLCVVFVMLSLTVFTVVSPTSIIAANTKNSGYEFNVEKSEDGAEADIVGQASKGAAPGEVEEIIGPDGETFNPDKVSYHVTENGVYDFKVNYASETGKKQEKISVSVENLLPPQNQVMVRDLKAMRGGAAATIDIPMYIDGEINPRGTYAFQGGDITGIENQEWDQRPYRFDHAEIRITDGAAVETYPISYYDKIGGIFYYVVAKDGGTAQDFDVAYEAPPDSQVAFVFTLDTTEYPVTIVNGKMAEGFSVNVLSGMKKGKDGNYYANSTAPVKVQLTYPAGYYVKNPPEGKAAVGISFDFKDPALEPEVTSDPKERTVTYAFNYPDQPVTMTVVGDKDTGSLTYGLYDGSSSFQNYSDLGETTWTATDAAGNYTPENARYGAYNYDGSATYQKMQVLGGASTPVTIKAGLTKDIATGTFNSDQALDFEYVSSRYKINPGAYYMWPAPTLNLCYFPNGEDYSAGPPIVETIPLWDPGQTVDPADPTAHPPMTLEPYTAANGATITITVEESIFTDKTIRPGFKPTAPYPSYKAHVKIENMKNSFYLKTQSSSSVQGPHYFRNLENISLGSVNGQYDTCYLDSDTQNNNGDGGDDGQISFKSIAPGGIFIDKLAVYNRNMPDGNKVPWAADADAFFKFEITPKWGYTNPRIESYGADPTPIMTNVPIEIQNKEENRNADLPLGSYSWFNPNQNRKDVSSFRYTMFMPVTKLTGRHDMRAIDVKTDKITLDIQNNGTTNNIVVPGTNGTTFDLLENDKITFNPNYQAPEKPNQTFVGFTGEITAPDNELLPPDYKLVLAKSLDNTVYFRPGDTVSISDYFRRDAGILLDSWNTNKTLSPTEQERLNLLMYSGNLKVKFTPIYKEGTSTEGQTLTGEVNKYLQDVSAAGNTAAQYNTTAFDRKTVEVITGSHITFTNFAETYDNPADGYTYYHNAATSVIKHEITQPDEELASVKYDRGLEVLYQKDKNVPFDGISDTRVYRTYDGSNQAVIKFPTVDQYPPGKAFDHWTVEELDDSGQWNQKPGLELSEEQTPTVYSFSSGPDANNKSIRLTAVWKDIAPEYFVSIPMNIVLTENNSNLNDPDQKHAGSGVTVSYQQVYGNDKAINVDVLKSFDLTSVNDPGKTVEVTACDKNGNPLQNSTTADSRYVSVALLGSSTAPGAVQTEKLWFNTVSQSGNEIYKGTFNAGSSLASGETPLFYISPGS